LTTPGHYAIPSFAAATAPYRQTLAAAAVSILGARLLLLLLLLVLVVVLGCRRLLG
jgi:hypothetical protein